jgi:shikimate dehydrogenase
MSLRFGVLGWPIDHSLSPAMHSAALAAVGLEGNYVKLQCDESGFRTLIRELRAGKWDGFNVTMPHKALAFAMCDSTTPGASIARSVNTLKISDSVLEGHSSDVVAFQKLFSSSAFGGAPILVLGSGGSAAAAIAGSDSEVYLSSRNPRSVASLIERFAPKSITPIPFGSAVAGAIVVNATPLGMKGEKLPAEIIDVAGGLIDLPYGTRPTPAVAESRNLSIPVCDGYRFLAHQATESFLWWTGQEIDVELMETTARNG